MSDILAVRRVGEQFRSFLRLMNAKHVPFMAGSIAYSAFLSLFPLLLLILIIASAIGGDQLTEYVLSRAGTYLSPTGQDIVFSSVHRTADRTQLSILGIVVLIWSVLRVFRGLDTAFSEIYETHRGETLSGQLIDGATALITMVLAVGVVLLTSAAFTLDRRLIVVRVVEPVVLILGLSIIFLPMYYVFPDSAVSLREGLPGAIVAATGWTILETVFVVYVRHSSVTELYGAIGAVILLITWLYFGALVILIGAVTNVVLSARTTAPGAKLVTDGPPHEGT